jgi:hypothetical protein
VRREKGKGEGKRGEDKGKMNKVRERGKAEMTVSACCIFERAFFRFIPPKRAQTELVCTPHVVRKYGFLFSVAGARRKRGTEKRNPYFLGPDQAYAHGTRTLQSDEPPSSPFPVLFSPFSFSFP